MIGVVIPVRNGAATLAQQLDALAAQQVTGDWRVYVADNGSTDGSAALARSYAARLPLEVLDAGAEPGINHGRNAGARAAIADGATVLMFCDADDVVGAGWVMAMARAAEQWDVWGGVLDRVQLGDPRRLRQGAIHSRELNRWPGYLPSASGAALGCRTSAWQSIGGFDLRFRGGNDDVDFCWRVQQAGGAIGFVPDAVVHYRERATDAAVFRQFRAYGLQDPLLYRTHRQVGLPRASTRAALRTWAYLATRWPFALRASEARSVWVRVAGRRLGRLHGMLRYRVWYP